MNAEIKAYWEKFHGAEASLDETNSFYRISTGKGVGAYIIAMRCRAVKLMDRQGTYNQAYADLSDESWLYPFNGDLHTEPVMLRLLNLRAFL